MEPLSFDEEDERRVCGRCGAVGLGSCCCDDPDSINPDTNTCDRATCPGCRKDTP